MNVVYPKLHVGRKRVVKRAKRSECDVGLELGWIWLTGGWRMSVNGIYIYIYKSNSDKCVDIVSPPRSANGE